MNHHFYYIRVISKVLSHINPKIIQVVRRHGPSGPGPSGPRAEMSGFHSIILLKKSANMFVLLK